MGAGAVGADGQVDATGLHRFFRVLMTGVNSSKGHELRCSGFEIYGQVFVDEPVSTMTSPLWYLREWALEALLNSLLYQRARLIGVRGEGDEEAQRGEEGDEEHAPVPDVCALVETVGREMGINASGFVGAVAGMASADAETDLRVAALAAMSVLGTAAAAAAAAAAAVMVPYHNSYQHYSQHQRRCYGTGAHTCAQAQMCTHKYTRTKARATQ